MISAFVPNPALPARRMPGGDRTAVRVLTPDTLDLGRDLLFAVTTASITWDLRSAVGHLPIFLVFAIFTFIASIPNILATSQSLRLFVAPMFCFFCIHLISAFHATPLHLPSHASGIRIFFQFVSVTAFVWPFAVRYSQTSMSRYLRLTGALLLGTLVFVLAYHAAHHRYFSWKLLGHGKSVFDLLPIMLVVLKRSKFPSSHLIFAILLPIALTLILISGERKAYILLVLMSPLIINFKNPLVYIVPVGVIACLPLLLLISKHGYVAGQIGTLIGFTQGQIAHTHSNDERYFAVKLASKLFRQNPVFGIGTNGYQLYVERVFYIPLGVHDDWLRVAAENGVVGLFFYSLTVLYGFIGLFRKKAFGYIRSKDDKIIAYALFATCLMYLTFEAYEYEVLIAFCVVPLIQFLRFSPSPPAMDVGVGATRDGPSLKNAAAPA